MEGEKDSQEVLNAVRDRSSIRPRWASRPGGGRASRTPRGLGKLSDTVRRGANRQGRIRIEGDCEPHAVSSRSQKPARRC